MSRRDTTEDETNSTAAVMNCEDNFVLISTRKFHASLENKLQCNKLSLSIRSLIVRGELRIEGGNGCKH